jgi:hypothetical protein
MSRSGGVEAQAHVGDGQVCVVGIMEDLDRRKEWAVDFGSNGRRHGIEARGRRASVKDMMCVCRRCGERAEEMFGLLGMVPRRR